jgi:hypothetical protein
MLRKALDFFLSLRTAVWLLPALILFLLAGAFVMPAREEFQGINAVALFQWLRQNPAGATWWLWGSIFFLCLLAANTIVCSAESVIRKRPGRQWLLVISPQVIHIGFLFVLLAHLMSSIGGAKDMVAAREGSVVALPNGLAMGVTSIQIETDPEGYLRDWRAEIEYISEGVSVKKDFLAPNRPSFFRGLGIYLKDARPYPVKACLIEISREPGAPWALAGAVFFMAGSFALIALKTKREK